MKNIVSMIEFRHIIQSPFHGDISYIMGFDIHNADDMDISVTELLCIYLLIDYIEAIDQNTGDEYGLSGALVHYLTADQWERTVEIDNKYEGERYEQKH